MRIGTIDTSGRTWGRLAMGVTRVSLGFLVRDSRAGVGNRWFWPESRVDSAITRAEHTSRAQFEELVRSPSAGRGSPDPAQPKRGPATLQADAIRGTRQCARNRRRDSLSLARQATVRPRLRRRMANAPRGARITNVPGSGTIDILTKSISMTALSGNTCHKVNPKRVNPAKP